MRLASLDDHRADGDGELALAIEPKPAERSRVEPARAGFEFGDDFAGAFFRRAGDAAAGEARAKCRGVIDLGAQAALDRGDEMEHLLVAFELEQFRDGDAAEFAHAAEVVA